VVCFLLVGWNLTVSREKGGGGGAGNRDQKSWPGEFPALQQRGLGAVEDVGRGTHMLIVRFLGGIIGKGRRMKKRSVECFAIPPFPHRTRGPEGSSTGHPQCCDDLMGGHPPTGVISCPEVVISRFGVTFFAGETV
jgi:hypothetical protein